MAILLAAIAALLPLTLAPRLLFFYDITPKIAILLLGAALALPLALRRGRARSRGLSLFGMLLAAQAASVALSTVFSADRALSLGGGNWRRLGLITQFALLIVAWIAARFASKGVEQVLSILRAIAVAGIPAAVYGILQYFGLDPLIDPRAYHIGEAPFTIVRPPGTLGYVSYFATYLLSVIFAGAALVLVEKTRAWKLTGAVAAALGSFALILTGTRAAMLGLVCGAALFAILLRPRLRARYIAVPALAAALIAAFYFSPPGQLLRSRTRWFADDPAGGARLILWRDSVRMAAARPLAGWGPDTFSPEFPRFQSAELARARPEFYQESPHNIFLDALVSQGIPGAAILIALTALGFYAVAHAKDRALASSVAAVLAAIVVSQQFTVFISVTALYFYLTLGLLVALWTPSAYAPAAAAVNRGRLAACLAASLVFAAFAVALITADAALARVRHLIASGDLPQAAALHQFARRWEPPGMRTELGYSRAMGGAARNAKIASNAILGWQEALAAAESAARDDEERQNAWLNLAEFYAMQNDFGHTEQSLRSASQCAPAWFKPHWLLARLLVMDGRPGQAKSEARLALDLSGSQNPEIVRTCNEILASPDSSRK